MKFDVMSDLHLDFHIKHSNNDKSINRFIDSIKPEKCSDVLIIAGDIGHVNAMNIRFMELMLKYYKHICFVLGNHDYYLGTRSQVKKYGDSYERANEMKNHFKNHMNIHYLGDGIFEYEGIKIGGIDSWYDKKSFTNQLEHTVDNLYRQSMNDPLYIHCKEDYVTRSTLDKFYLKTICDDVDIMVTHVAPVVHPITVDDKYLHSELNVFYSFDGEELIKDNIKLWIYGHMHDHREFIYNDTRFFCNPFGYPHERRYKSNIIKTVEITK